MIFHVYAPYGPSFNKIYIGYTSDLEARLLSHNQLSTKGRTIKFEPWIIIHQEPFQYKRECNATQHLEFRQIA
ncbi:MAG: GIY-YIG nuclease family protein [Bacteroidia bacterium]|nr:GIY-YIG nuclease family protein [Bacteroidia bacterium]